MAASAGDVTEKRHHLLVSGTGRAGTSFIVKYLAELGLDTHVDGPSLHWDDAAGAGLENLPLLDEQKSLPYVVKSPWLTEYIDQVLARNDMVIDAVIIPTRDLVEVATSRTVVELQHLYTHVPQMAKLDKSWESWGTTPGGTVFSLNPLDQARLLAVSFHQLVRHLVEADIPLIFVAFPRIIEDADYLYGKLRPYLPAEVSIEQARRAHRAVAKLKYVRIERELHSDESPLPFRFENPGVNYPEHHQVDGIALRREVARLRCEVAKLSARDGIARSAMKKAGAQLLRFAQHIFGR